MRISDWSSDVCSSDLVNVDDARRDFDAQLARLARRNEAVLQAERHDADGAVAAHGEAAAGLDEQDAAVGVVAGRRIEEAARHHVVPARLEAEAGAETAEAGRDITQSRGHWPAPPQRGQKQ